MSEKCKKHPGVELEWMPGEPAHPRNQYCPLCESYKDLAQFKETVAELEAKLAEATRIVVDAPELNMGNYDDAEVLKLNNAMIELSWLLLTGEAIDAAREESDG